MNKLFKTSAILAAIGLILASYLFYSYLAPTPPGWCDINSTVNCNAVTKGPLAEFLGILGRFDRLYHHSLCFDDEV